MIFDFEKLVLSQPFGSFLFKALQLFLEFLYLYREVINNASVVITAAALAGGEPWPGLVGLVPIRLIFV